MGLWVSHDCWVGAYSAFYRWRNGLAEAAGYELTEGGIKDFDGRREYVLPMVKIGDWTKYSPENFMGDWPDGPPGEDPLLVLIVHSDCDGKLPIWSLKPLADRIEGLIDKLPTEPETGHIGDWRAKTQKFVDGLRTAAAADEEVEFG